MASRSVDIYEHQLEPHRKKRVIRHTFYGSNPKEAKHYERSHRKSDRFLNAALSGRKFKGIQLEAIERGGKRKMARKHRRGGRRSKRY